MARHGVLEDGTSFQKGGQNPDPAQGVKRRPVGIGVEDDEVGGLARLQGSRRVLLSVGVGAAPRVAEQQGFQGDPLSGEPGGPRAGEPQRGQSGGRLEYLQNRSGGDTDTGEPLLPGPSRVRPRRFEAPGGT